MKRQLAVVLAMCGGLVLLAACGKKHKKDDGDDEETTVVSGGGQPSQSGSGTAGYDDVQYQKINLSSGQAFAATLATSGAFLADGQAGSLEISILKENGEEVAYSRKEGAGDEVTFTPDQDGSYILAVKNNQGTGAVATDVTGADSVGQIENANARVEAAHADVSLKAMITFASTCRAYADGGNSTKVTQAPEGRYFAQPFVFLGKVGPDHKVSPIDTATIKLKFGSDVQTLAKLADFDLNVFREMGGLTKDQHVAYTRAFYQGYLGGAGEMYTVDTFRFGGDCEHAPTFALGSDVSQAEVQLEVVDAANGLNEVFPVRASRSVPFSTYMADGARLSDYTQCTYDRLTGLPTPYNGDGQCKTFSLAAAPFVKADYEKPSDATRILYYGYSYPKAWYRYLIDHADALSSGVESTVELPGCLANGGLIAVPISQERTELPLAEFHLAADDIIQVARKSGSYTALTGFYQGSVDASGSLAYPACIPNGTETCAAFKVLTVSQQDCKIKADSGISVTSVGEAFTYPEYFEMSGVIAP